VRIDLQQAFPAFNVILIYLRIQSWFLSAVSKYLNFTIFSKDLLISFTLLFYLTLYWWDTNIYV